MGFVGVLESKPHKRQARFVTLGLTLTFRAEPQPEVEVSENPDLGEKRKNRLVIMEVRTGLHKQGVQ